MTRAVAAALAAAALLGCGEEAEQRPAARTPAAAEPAAAGRVLSADDRTFARRVEQAPGPVLVLFWAPWSDPDKIVLPYLDDAARERPGLTVVKVNVDRGPKAAQRHNVLSIPTAIVLVDGRPRGDAVVGAQPQAKWERALDLDGVSPRR